MSISGVHYLDGIKLRSVGVDPEDRDYLILEHPERGLLTVHINHGDLVSLLADILESRLVQLHPVLS